MSPAAWRRRRHVAVIATIALRSAALAAPSPEGLTHEATIAGRAPPAEVLSLLQASVSLKKAEASTSAGVHRGASIGSNIVSGAATRTNLEIGKGEFKFYMYALDEVEPRFNGKLAGCTRKGADYALIQSLKEHPQRTWMYTEADVKVVPCLFETFLRCASVNKEEKPPALEGTQSGASLLQQRAELNQRDIPENFEQIPWRMEFDTETAQCLERVKNTEVYQKTMGSDHFFLVANWAMQFGRLLKAPTFANMTLGRIEVIDKVEGLLSNRMAATTSKCSVVVPYMSDVSYVEDFSHTTTFEEWRSRPNIASFRFSERQYVLWCNSTVCDGAVDATPLRKQSLLMADKLGSHHSIARTRVPLKQYATELHQARYCLVIRGDTPTSHAFYDAVAASCVPVLISDRFGDVATPFARGRLGRRVTGGVDFSSFTVQISEKAWLGNIDLVLRQLRAIDEDEAAARSLYENLQKNRPALVWSMPGSTIGNHALDSARMCVKGED